MKPAEKRYFWTTQEVAIIKQHYPTGGAKACAPLLPRRTIKSIQQQARLNGIYYGNNKPKPYRRWESSPAIDRAITEAYARPTDKTNLKRLAATLGRPYWWIKKRAMILGLATARLTDNREPEWSAAEVELLQQHAHKVPDVIARIFRANGHSRSATAIVVKRRRMGCDTVDIDHYTATQLADEFGIDAHCVTRWIESGWLKAARRGTDRVEAQGGDQWWIKRKHVREFVAESIGIIDIRKVDKVWFVDLLVNG